MEKLILSSKRSLMEFILACLSRGRASCIRKERIDIQEDLPKIQ